MNDNPVRPVTLPRELRLGALWEMEPHQRGFMKPQYVWVDADGKVWVNAEAAHMNKWSDAYDIEARRTETGVELRVPDCWRFSRAIEIQCRYLMAVEKIEVVESVSSDT